MKIQQYKVMRADRASDEIKIGDFVYSCAGYDYGTASDDSRTTGIEHTSVTKDSTGAYPFFTMPKADLDAVLAEPPAPSVTDWTRPAPQDRIFQERYMQTPVRHADPRLAKAKPCPFCNQRVLEISRLANYVHCLCCGADGPEISDRERVGRDIDHVAESAVFRWNTRI